MEPGQKAAETGCWPLCFCPAPWASQSSRLRMRESLSAPAAMHGLLRYLHPRRAGRSLVATAEKHLYARGTALWTHIRDLVCRGKVGQQMDIDFQVGWEGRGPCHLDVLNSCFPCLSAYPNAGLLVHGFCQSCVLGGKGPLDYCSLKGKGGICSA